MRSFGLPPAAGVLGEDRRAGEAEQVVALECLGDRGVHVAELGAVALVEDQHDVPVVDRVALVLLDEPGELLDRGDDDPRGRCPPAASSARASTCSSCGALLEAVVLAHGLVVEVLAVDDEQDLVDVR